MDYTSHGFNSFGFNFRSLGHRTRERYSASQRDLWDRTSFLNPVSISRGTVTTTLGGVTEIRDSTGTNVLFTANPNTGVVTITGSVIANQSVNVGTVSDSSFSGTLTNIGTFTLGIGTAGTIYDSLFANGIITNSIISGTGGTINNLTLGTPQITGGVTFGMTDNQGTFVSPRIQGTIMLDTSAGSSVLGSNGQLAIQTYGGSAILVCRLAGTTYRFTPSGAL